MDKKKEQYFVSIIIPFYNEEKLLARCIESVKHQTYLKWELLLIDDGSTDRSEAICKEAITQDTRIKYKRQENRGVSTARNWGIDCSKGDILVFVDADDWLEENALQVIIESWNENLEVLIFDYNECHSDGAKRRRHLFSKKMICFGEDEIYSKKSLLRDILMFSPEKEKNAYRDICEVWGKAYLSTVIKKEKILFPVDMKIAEDQIFNLRVWDRCNSIKYISRSLYNCYINSDSVTQKMYFGGGVTCEHIENFERRLVYANEVVGKYFEDTEVLDAYNGDVCLAIKSAIWAVADMKERELIRQAYLFSREHSIELIQAKRMYKFSLKDRAIVWMCSNGKIGIVRIVYRILKGIQRGMK